MYRSYRKINYNIKKIFLKKKLDYYNEVHELFSYVVELGLTQQWWNSINLHLITLAKIHDKKIETLIYQNRFKRREI